MVFVKQRRAGSVVPGPDRAFRFGAWRRGRLSGGGAVLAASLRRFGVRMAGNARSTGVEHNAPDGGFSALLLNDGSAIDGDLLVLSCGVRPRTELAEGCGLSTGTGILVDHRLRAHHEPHIFAIGDCAEVRCPDPACGECRNAKGPSGLVGPGWRQAQWLAEYLTLLATCTQEEADALQELPQEQAGVIVLKARGMNMAVAGDNGAEPWDEEALTAGAVNGWPRLQIAQWADPEHGRYVKMTTRAGTGCGGCQEDIKGLIEKHFQAAPAA